MGTLRPVHKAHEDEAETKIVFDKFHIVQPLHTAVDQDRRAEHRGLLQAEDDRLTGTKYLWLRRPKDLPAAQRTQLRTLLQRDLKVTRAWLFKEQFQRFWTYTRITERRRRFSPAGFGGRPIAGSARWSRSPR